MSITRLTEQIFDVTNDTFESLALEIFRHQYEHIEIYRNYIQALKVNVDTIRTITDIPFLPISFFKSHAVASDCLPLGDLFFESSGTSGQVNSKHIIQDVRLYEQSFQKCIHKLLGDLSGVCIMGLLPSYLERQHSSLVYMVNCLIQESGHPASGFYLHNHDELFETLQQLEASNTPCLLFGVTYALLDFAANHSIHLKSTRIIETGGMKGRRAELLRDEVHALLKKSFGLDQIYSEYGMTELLSQAYSLKDGMFTSPPWMNILIRDLSDPFQITTTGKGALNIIDLANIYSCCFIATDDMGEVFDDGTFTVGGRIDHSDLRGCSLMTV